MKTDLLINRSDLTIKKDDIGFLDVFQDYILDALNIPEAKRGDIQAVLLEVTLTKTYNEEK